MKKKQKRQVVKTIFLLLENDAILPNEAFNIMANIFGESTSRVFVLGKGTSVDVHSNAWVDYAMTHNGKNFILRRNEQGITFIIFKKKD
jgi:hypothetical protein